MSKQNSPRVVSYVGTALLLLAGGWMLAQKAQGHATATEFVLPGLMLVVGVWRLVTHVRASRQTTK